MPQDKSVISLPSTSKTSVAPNVATNFQQVTYNEGIYITNSSLNATYPKSVVRVYKNPSNPKKVYFAAKDTSLLENYVFDLINKGATKDSNPNTFRLNDTKYYWSRTEDESSYRDFSTFSQPYNLDLQSDVTNKKINFYTLPVTSQQVLYMAGLNSDSNINLNFKEYNIFLKAKSYITDYQSYDLFKSNKAKYSEDSDIDNTNQPTIDKVALYEKFLFNNLTGSTNIDSDLNNIKPLSETDLQLNKSVQILNVNKIKFSDFINYQYDKKFMFLNDKSLYFEKDRQDSARNAENVDFILYSGGSINNLDPNNYILFGYNREYTTDDISGGIFNAITKGSTLPEADNAYSNTMGGQIVNPTSFNFANKLVAIIKQNYSISTIKDFEIFKILDDSTSFQFYNSINNLSDAYQGIIQKENDKVFNLNKELNGNDYISLFKLELDNINNFYTDSNITTTESILTNMYVFKDSFDYSNYGFFPTNFDETIYEFELDQELDFQNGAFVVAEIE